MDFARKQLEKYGWTDGKGLGKHENGISDALKTKIKRSVTGVGHNAAQDFTEHWWTTLYNKAASNVEVEQENSKTKQIKTKDDNDFEITNSTWKLQNKSKVQGEEGEYKNFFVKTAVLSNGGSKVEKLRESDTDEEPEERKDAFKMSDEELFAACGGRTAHKSARFGLKLTGKLARIKQQEENLLNLEKYKGYSHAKKHKLKDAVQESNMNELKATEDFESAEKLKKKRKKSKKKNGETNYETLEVENDQDMKDSNIHKEDIKPDIKFSKQKGDDDNQQNLGINVTETDSFSNSKKEKEKKKHCEVDVSEAIVESTNLEEVLLFTKKSKKKHRKCNK